MREFSLLVLITSTSMFTSGKENINVQLHNTSKDIVRAVGKITHEICMEGEPALNRAITSTRAQIPRRIEAIRKTCNATENVMKRTSEVVQEVQARLKKVETLAQSLRSITHTSDLNRLIEIMDASDEKKSNTVSGMAQ